MNNILSMFENAQLAEASYVDFFNDADNVTITTSDDVKAALIAKGFSSTQAIEFVANWQVVSQQPNTVGGYSGTLFKYIGNDPNSGFTNGEYVFSLRGTEPDYGINSTDLARVGRTRLRYAV